MLKTGFGAAMAIGPSNHQQPHADQHLAYRIHVFQSLSGRLSSSRRFPRHSSASRLHRSRRRRRHSPQGRSHLRCLPRVQPAAVLRVPDRVSQLRPGSVRSRADSVRAELRRDGRRSPAANNLRLDLLFC